MIKVLITGANGMVGRNIAEFEDGNNYKLLKPGSKELNLLDRSAIDQYINDNRPDIIIHSAGIVGGIQANMAQPVKFLVENTQMGINIIMSAFESGVKKFINLSSSCMYPREARNPLGEDLILKGELEPTNEGYAIAKITSTRLCEYITKENPTYQYKTIIPCNLYGRYDKFDPKHSHMLPAVIRKMHMAKEEKDSSISIWGDGKVRREFMYAEDLANFIYYAIPRFDSMPQNINVGLGFDFTINEYYKAAAAVVGFEGDFEHDLSKPVGMKQKLIDDSKLKQFGWTHKISLKEGIKKTYDYYLNEILNHE